DFFTSLRLWHIYLQEHLVFPFRATVGASVCRAVHPGDEVTVTSISLLDEDAGAIVRVRFKRRVYHLSLRELYSNNALEIDQLINDYRVWFSFHRSVYTRFPRCL